MNRHLDGTQQLVVIDNASTDEVEAAARAWQGETDFLRLDANQGFAAAANVGVARARHPAVVLLDPDTELVDSSLNELVATALELRALAGPRLLNPDGSVQPSASGPEVGLWPWLRAVLPGAITPTALLRSTEPYRLTDRARVQWLTGACVVAPRDVLLRLGSFDPAIHLYGEDLDLGVRAELAGVSSYFCPDTCRVVHHGGGSASLIYGSQDGALPQVMRTRRAVLRRAFGRRRETLGWWAVVLNLCLRDAAKVLARRESPRDRAALSAALEARTFDQLPRAPAESRRLRTLAVLHLAEAGGPSQHVRPWLAALAERGPLEVVVPGDGPARALYASLGQTSVLPYEPLTLPRSPFALLRFAARFVRETWSFARHFKRARPDLIFVVTTALPSALLATRLSRARVLVGAAEIFDKGYVRSRYRSVAGELTARFTERLAHGLVCWSDAIASQFRRDPAGPIVATVYPGVTPGKIAGDRDGFRERHGLTGADPCLAVLGNLTRGRGQHVVIRALPALQRTFPNVACIVAGAVLERPADIAYAAELRGLVDQLDLGDAVKFVGFVDPVEDVYAAADVVVNPALFNEPLGRVALEAMAAERPMVATRVGGIPEVVRDGVDGLLVDTGDPEAIVAAVSSLWTHAGLRERLVASGLARVKASFDEESGIAGFLRVVDEVLAGA